MTATPPAATLRPQIEVAPARALVDEPLRVRLTGLVPEQRVTLRAAMRDHGDHPWQAEAAYVADRSGTVDVASATALSGSYEGVDGMGLFWSMLPAQDASAEAVRGFATAAPLTATLTAEADGTAVATAIVERLLMADGVTATDVRERGIAGRLFLPAGTGPHPGVVVLGGSGGGLPAMQAAFLASHGLAALALAYFAFEGRPSVLADIPLEYFETAIAWLRGHERVKPDGIGVIGVSRGGELVLLLGSTFPEIRAVVSIVPSHMIWPGVGGGPGAQSWTFRGQPLPMMPPSAGSTAARAQQRPEEQTAPIDLTPGFLAALEDETAEARAAIPVERINGPVLLVSGRDDAMWPSTLMAERVMARLAAHQHPHPDQHLAYADAGHTVAGLPFLPAAPLPSRHPIAGLVFGFGGTARGVAAARADAWPRILGFLHGSL